MTFALTARPRSPLVGAWCSAPALVAWLCALVPALVIALVEALDQLARSVVRDRVVLWW